MTIWTIPLLENFDMRIFNQRFMALITNFISLYPLHAGKTDKRNRAVSITLRPMAGDTGYSFFAIQRQPFRDFHIIRDRYAYRVLAGYLSMAFMAKTVDVPVKFKIEFLFVLRYTPVAG
jgi:hypothetical protein